MPPAGAAGLLDVGKDVPPLYSSKWLEVLIITPLNALRGGRPAGLKARQALSRFGIGSKLPHRVEVLSRERVPANRGGFCAIVSRRPVRWYYDLHRFSGACNQHWPSALMGTPAESRELQSALRDMRNAARRGSICLGRESQCCQIYALLAAVALRAPPSDHDQD